MYGDDLPEFSSLTEDWTLEELVATFPAAGDYLAWRGLEAKEAWEDEETLADLCARWEVEWEELCEELIAWLEHSAAEEELEQQGGPVLVEWHERLDGSAEE